MGASPLEHSRSGVILEQLRVADVTPQRIDRLVTRHVHHLED